MSQREHANRSKGEALMASCCGDSLKATQETLGLGTESLMERVVQSHNLHQALEKVRKNKGSAGVDGKTVDDLWQMCVDEWPRIRKELLSGTYKPQPIRRVEIPKKSGGKRKLGIPTVMDRLIQQAILQVIGPIIDPKFSAYSFGFRPKRSAKDAVQTARSYIQAGYRYVVDVDLESFFDRVNHDILMDRLSKHIRDPRILRILRSYLESGVLYAGITLAREEGTPQGGPISPLLANVLLDEVDQILEKRNHKFIRYADDCNVYVRSRASGERVMSGLRKIYQNLKLKVNESKSAVEFVTRRKILGFSFYFGPQGTVKIRVSKEGIKSFKEKVRELTRRKIRISMEERIEGLRSYLLGWKGYFGLSETPKVFSDLDAWIRHRLRMLQLRDWKTPKRIRRALRELGANSNTIEKVAGNCRSWWVNSAMLLNSVLTNISFDQKGLTRLGR